MSLNTDRLPVGKKKEVDLADAYSEPANFLEIEGTNRCTVGSQASL